MEYTIIEASTAENLVRKVNSALSLGWRLVGGVSAVGTTHMQAMCKEHSMFNGLMGALVNRENQVEAYH